MESIQLDRTETSQASDKRTAAQLRGNTDLFFSNVTWTPLQFCVTITGSRFAQLETSLALAYKYEHVSE